MRKRHAELKYVCITCKILIDLFLYFPRLPWWGTVSAFCQEVWQISAFNFLPCKSIFHLSEHHIFFTTIVGYTGLQENEIYGEMKTQWGL